MYEISDIQTEQRDDTTETSALVGTDGKKDRVYFRWTGVPSPATGDAFLISHLHHAMDAGEKLVVRGSVSARLMENLALTQEIYRCWDYRKKIVDVEADEIRPAGALDATLAPDRGTLTFFSGGVDAYYTTVENIDRIDALVFVHGYEIPLRNTALRQRSAERLRDAAARLGKPLLEVETNYADVHTYRDWGHIYGSVLAAVGILHSAHYRRAVLATAETYRLIAATGIHPLLDPLRATDTMEFEHHGLEADRVDKIIALADTPVVFETLRVCFQHDGHDYNCGTCEKCARTQTSLAIAGLLDRVKTFNGPVTEDDVIRKLNRLVARDDDERFAMNDNIVAAQRMQVGPKLMRALRRAEARHHNAPHRRLIRGVRRRLRLPTHPMAGQ